MNYKKRSLRAFGLSILAVLGLMALIAAGAQAGEGEWLILTTNGLKTLKELSPQLESMTGVQEGTENLLQILGLNIRLYCEKVDVSNAHIVPLGHAKATLELLECKLTDQAGNENHTCLVHDVAANALGLLVKHPSTAGTQRWILLSPLSGLTFATPVLLDHLDEECTVSPLAISGHIVASINTASGAHATELLISTKNTLTLFPNDVLKFGGQVAHLKLDGLLKLSGTHAGRAWGYHAL